MSSRKSASRVDRCHLRAVTYADPRQTLPQSRSPAVPAARGCQGSWRQRCATFSVELCMSPFGGIRFYSDVKRWTCAIQPISMFGMCGGGRLTATTELKQSAAVSAHETRYSEIYRMRNATQRPRRSAWMAGSHSVPTIRCNRPQVSWSPVATGGERYLLASNYLMTPRRSSGWSPQPHIHVDGLPFRVVLERSFSTFPSDIRFLIAAEGHTPVYEIESMFLSLVSHRHSRASRETHRFTQVVPAFNALVTRTALS